MVLLTTISLTNLTNQREWRTIEAIERVVEAAVASTQVNLYEVKTHLSSLVERVATGEEFVIAKASKPRARLVALATNRSCRVNLARTCWALPILPTILMLRCRRMCSRILDFESKMMSCLVFSANAELTNLTNRIE